MWPKENWQLGQMAGNIVTRQKVGEIAISPNLNQLFHHQLASVDEFSTCLFLWLGDDNEVDRGGDCF